MQRLRTLLVLSCVLALVLGVTASNVVAPPPPAPKPAAAASSHGPSLWQRLLGHLGVGGKNSGSGGPPSQAVAAAPVGPPRRPAAGPAAPTGPARRVKELVGRRTATGRFFALSDGRVQAELGAGPVNYRDGEGRWQPIDTRLLAVTGRPGFAYAATKNRFGSLFGTSSDRLLRVEQAGWQVTVGLPGPVTTLSPQVQGSTITYPGALGAGADLAWRVTPQGIKEQIVLAGRPADPTWRFNLRLGGVVARAQADGSIGLFPTGGGDVPLWVMPKPFMTDAQADPSSPYGRAWSDQVTQTVSQQGDRIQVTVRADPAWLGAAERRWPVVVDPTIKIQPIDWWQSLDVEIRSDLPTTNLDDIWQLAVGSTTAIKARSLVKFPLSDIPSGTQIASAQLQAWFDGSWGVSPDTAVTIEARRVTASWADTTATWNSINTAFGEAGLGTASRGINQSAAWHSFDVKNIVQTWLNGTQPNYGFMLKAQNETLNQGGPIYEAAPGLASYGYDYGGETQNGPRLLVTYGRPSVNLASPNLITATGAQLSWSAYVDPTPGSVPEDDLVEYQVHRRLNGTSSTTPTCGQTSWAWCRYPSRVAVLPPGTTSYLDTSAPPTPADDPSPQGKAYDYWVVVKTRDGQASASGVQVAWLPKAGRTRLILQGSALDTTLSSTQHTTGHDVFDGRPWLGVGNNSSTYGITRSLLKFDTTQVPTSATVLDADLSLWDGVGSFGTGTATYNLHKLTRAFNEAAASWDKATSTVSWTTPGGDYNATVLGSLSGFTANDEPKWRTWKGSGLVSTVQGWVANPSTNPNYGFLLKTASESPATQRTLFVSSEVGEPMLRPRLAITYTERTPANTYHAPATPEELAAGDTTSVPVTVTNTTAQTLRAGVCPLDQYQASYFANTTLGGTPSGERCEAAIDNDWGSGGPSGVGVGADNFSVRWTKTQGFAAGTYTFSATADDGVRVWLDGVLLIDQWKNQPPTTYTVARSVAAGDHEIKMEYYEGSGGAVAKLSVTASGLVCPLGQYQASYFANETLSGTPSGQRCEGAIDNDWGTGGPSGVGVGVDAFSVRWVKTQTFTADTYTFTATADDGVRVWLDSTLLIDGWKNQPPTTYTASRAVTAGSHQVKMEYYEHAGGAVAKLRITGAPWQLTYKWLLPDGSGTADPASPASQLMTQLPRDVAPGNTLTVDAQLKVLTPADAGATRIDRVLTWDLYNQASNTYLSAASGGVGGLGQHVGVEQPTSDELGLERFYQYAGKNTGSGSTVMVNQHSGNLVWSYNPIANPDRGPATFLRLTYNSMDTSNSAAGFGFSIAASSVMRLGTPLQFHPPGQDWPTTIRLTDGDGTTHTFTLNQHGSSDPAVWDYDHPFGVHLYLQKNSSTDPARAWVLTRPDRTKFYFDADGYQSATRDANGNELLFTYDRRKSNNKPIKFLRYLTDAAGRQTLTITNYAKGQSYSYYDSTTNQKVQASNLTNPFIIDQVQTIIDISGRQLFFTYSDKGLLKEVVDGNGDPQAKTFLFDYDMTQGNKNVKLVRAIDPRGHATTLTYNDPPVDDPQFHWWAKTITDRLGKPTSFTYVDPDGPQGNTVNTTVNDPSNNQTVFVTDGFGRPTSITNPLGELTQLAWDGDHNLSQLTEANGAISKYTYDPNTGYPLTIQDAQAVKDGTAATVLTYNTTLSGHVADLATKKSPEGRTWTFGYDQFGNLTSVTDPKGTATPTAGDFTTTYTYDNLGQLTRATDANGHHTDYSGYDLTGDLAVGYPKTITNHLQQSTSFVYDARGNVTVVTDARQKTSTYTYDVFGRSTGSRVPMDQANNRFIVTPAPVYDPNDNVTQVTAPNGAVTTAVYDDADQTTSITLPKDVATDPARTWTFTYDPIGNLFTQTEPNGTLTTNDPNDFTTTYGYDKLGRVVSVTSATGDKLTYDYDNVGNLTLLVDPKKTASADPTDYTTRYTYDLAHRLKVITDALGFTTTRDLDKDGQVIGVTDKENHKRIIKRDERAMAVEVDVPHATGSTRVTQYEYDAVGNRTKVITPRGVETAGDTTDFLEETVYDELNRPAKRLLAFAAADPKVNTPDEIDYSYDEVGNLTKVSAPPSSGQTVRDDTVSSYFDNGWVKQSTDAFDISTTFDYNDLGQQIKRTLSPAGASASDGSARSMSWTYYPDGKLAGRSDQGVPSGKAVALVDNSDAQNITATGTWTAASTGTGFQGPDYRVHAAGAGSDSFTWRVLVPQDGTYEVFVRYTGATATTATYSVKHHTGSASTIVDQTKQQGQWVSLGRFGFAADDLNQQVSLAQSASGTVAADAVKLVRDNTGEPNDQTKDFVYHYDPTGNATSIEDHSPGAKVDTYVMTYDGVNRAKTIQEKLAGVLKHTTAFPLYDPNSNPSQMTHDQMSADYHYDTRDLVDSVKNIESAGAVAKTETFTYTPNGWRQHQTKANGNTVDSDYFFDGLLQHQAEKKANGTVVNEHTYVYDANGNKTSDVSKKQNADNHAAYLNWTFTATYDPRDRLTRRTKTDTATGATLDTELYSYDANANITDQTVGGKRTLFNYDRNRLQTSVTNGVTSAYNYDPFGRLNTIVALDKVLERDTYDGFERVSSIARLNDAGTATTTSRFTYDPLDRRASETKNAGTTGEKTTNLNYLGLASMVLSEDVAGQLTKTYQYSPWGERLSQIKHNSDGSTEDGFYGYNGHTDVDEVTDSTGDTKATYGYSAYGQNDAQAFTGIDKPDPQDPTKDLFNAYRFNAERFDPGTGKYDMGFRQYDAGLNRFLQRDRYNGALADLRLTTDPWTMNRYAFGGGNPLSNVELDGHNWLSDRWHDFSGWASDNADTLISLGRDTAMTGLGMAMMTAGAGGEGLGALLDATGIGAVPGVALNVASAGLIAAGAGLTYVGARGALNDIYTLANSTGGGSGGASSGGGGGGPSLRTPRIGDADGGPGKWVEVNRGPPGEHWDFQESVTGVSRNREYEINKIKFDGWDPKAQRVTDAKHGDLGGLINDKTGRFEAWYMRVLRRGGGIAKEANQQLKAVEGTGVKVRWTTSTTRQATALREAFRDLGTDIDVTVAGGGGGGGTVGGTTMRMI